MPLKDYAFKTTFTPYRKLFILGQPIRDALIKSISPLNAELDYPDLTTFNIGNVSITLFDVDGDFNPNNPDNFWSRNWDRTDIPEHYNQIGYRGSVELHIGYENDGRIESEKLFDGEVANIRVNLQPPEVIIEAVDASQNLRPAKVYDFGIARDVLLQEDPDTTYSGRYPFPPHSLPSERSVSALTSITHDEMTDVGTISTEGITSPLNYQIADNAIETEGGPLWDPNRVVAMFKDAYRYKRIDTLLKDLLRHYNIRNPDIDISPQHTDTPHFASHGRVGWELEHLATDLSHPWDWDGYVKDVVYDSTRKRYYMLYGRQANHRPDRLISYDVATDRWERVATTKITINNTAREYEMWQLATKDFDTFFILATVHQPNGGDLLDFGVYNAHEFNSSIRILKYVKTSDTWQIIDDLRGNSPHIGFYYAETERPPPKGQLTHRPPILPDNRTIFAVKRIDDVDVLVYRGVGGIYTYQLSDGTKTKLKDLPDATILSYDCWIGNDAETTFFGWIEAPDTNSTTLRIDNGNGDEIINATYQNDDNPFWQSHGTAQLITISDMHYHDGNLYAMLQSKAGTDNQGKSEGALIKVEVAHSVVKLLKSYDSFVRGARSPVLHNDAVYYFEGSHHQYGNVPDAEAYPDDTGHLIRIDDDAVVDLGACWRSAFENPLSETDDVGFGRHGGTASPMLSDGEAIHFWAGYGDLTDPNAFPVNDINNWHWLQYSRRIPQRIPVFRTNGKQAWELMNELARLTNATMSYRGGRFSFLPRATRQTTLISDISDSATSIIVEDASLFENTGLVLINDELIAYKSATSSPVGAISQSRQSGTGVPSYQFIGSNELSDLTRGAENSRPTSHKKGDTVLFVDGLVFNHPDKQNLGSLRFKPDFLGIYNQLTARLTPIAGENAEVFIESPDSIAANGEKPREFNLDVLSWHERPWAKVLLDAYLTEMQQAQFEVNLELPWSPHLKLGQTLVVDQQVVAHLRWTPVRILRISHDFDARTTHITGRTFGLRRIAPTTLAFDKDIPHYTFIVDEMIQFFELPEAVGGLGTIGYTLSELPAGLEFNDAVSPPQVSGTPTTIGTHIMTYTATDASTVPQTARLRFRITIVNPLAFDDVVPDDLVFQAGCYIDYQMPSASGGIGQIFYEFVEVPNGLTFNPDTRRLQGIMPNGLWSMDYYARDSAEMPTSLEMQFRLHGESSPKWTSFYITDTEYGLVDDAADEVRLYDHNGKRKSAITEMGGGEFNIQLGNGTWTGAAISDDKKVYIDNYRAVFHTLQNIEQPTEQISHAEAVWVDVALLNNRWAILDKNSGSVWMYSLTGERMETEDIDFGMCAPWRSFAPNAAGTFLYLLVEDSPILLAWDIAAKRFVITENIPIIDGSVGWQSVRLIDGNRLALVRANSTRIVVIDIATKTRVKSADVVLGR